MESYWERSGSKKMPVPIKNIFSFLNSTSILICDTNHKVIGTAFKAYFFTHFIITAKHVLDNNGYYFFFEVDNTFVKIKDFCELIYEDEINDIVVLKSNKILEIAQTL